MDITDYAAYFHDGSIFDVRTNKDNIEFSMESAEMSDEDLLENIQLSETNTLKGNYI